MPTNPPLATPEQMEAQLAELAEQNDERLIGLATKYARLKNLASRAKDEATKAGNDLREELEKQGLTSISAKDGVTVYLSTHKGWGVSEGDSPEKYLDNMEALRKFIETYNPTQTSTTQATIKQTVDAYRAKLGEDAPIPDFICETEHDRLNVRNS